MEIPEKYFKDKSYCFGFHPTKAKSEKHESTHQGVDGLSLLVRQIPHSTKKSHECVLQNKIEIPGPLVWQDPGQGNFSPSVPAINRILLLALQYYQLQHNKTRAKQEQYNSQFPSTHFPGLPSTVAFTHQISDNLCCLGPILSSSSFLRWPYGLIPCPIPT